MRSLLKAPPRLFSMIESIVEQKYKPDSEFPYGYVFSERHWHELMSGKEAFTPDQIQDEDSKHCCAGWIVALTPNASNYEKIRIDVDNYANEILVASGRAPIPLAIYHGEIEDWLKIIKMRARQERELYKDIDEDSN